MPESFSRDEIFDKIKQILIEDFEIEESMILPDADLFKDLDLDSIDAVDLAVKLQQYTGKKISPQEFKDIKTFNDVVDAVVGLVNQL